MKINTIELNIIYKLIKRELKEYNKIKTESITQEVLQTTRSTKTIQKRLSMGLKWTNCLKDEKGEKQYGRRRINKIASEYYKKLYNDIDLNKLQPTVNKNTEPPFLKEEIQHAIKNLKNNEASSENITDEQIKFDGEALVKTITILFNDILENHQLPEQWKRSDTILIFKKGDRDNI